MPLHILIILLIPLLLMVEGCPKPTDPGDDKPKQPYYVWTVDTLFYDYPGIPPDQVNIASIWGSSPHDVWAVGGSDVIVGELWHYNGISWKPVHNWPTNGIDVGGSYINDVSSVTGFDSANVFVFGFHGYDTTGTDLVLKWNGQAWSVVPWIGGVAPRGGLGWGIKQNNDKLWAVSSTGQVVKYENGLLSVDYEIPNYRLGNYQIAALDNGEVYVTAYRDSVDNGIRMGTIINLYGKNLLGIWSLLEKKIIIGGDEDGNGLGSFLVSITNRLFTINRGLWERVGTLWVKSLGVPNFGGSCFVAENNLWVYFNRDVWHYDGKQWNVVDVPILQSYPNHYLYLTGWSDGKEIFISLTQNGKQSFMLHGKLTPP